MLTEQVPAYPNLLGAAGPCGSSRLTTHVSKVQHIWQHLFLKVKLKAMWSVRPALKSIAPFTTLPFSIFNKKTRA